MYAQRERLIALSKSWPGQVAEPPKLKKLVGIESLVRWAYCDELPKESGSSAGSAPFGFSAGWGGIERYSRYLAKIDEGILNRFGVVPDDFATNPPQPDAIAIADAVAALDGYELGLPAGWDPFTDLGDLGGLHEVAVGEVLDRLTVIHADGSRKLRSTTSSLVFRRAIMGPPVWQADKPEVKFFCGANGRPKWFVRRLVTSDVSDTPYEVEADGWCERKHRPYDDAYRKQYLDPDPVDAGVARGEYEIWLAALGILVEELAGKLEAHEPLPSSMPERPWDNGQMSVTF